MFSHLQVTLIWLHTLSSSVIYYSTFNPTQNKKITDHICCMSLCLRSSSQQLVIRCVLGGTRGQLGGSSRWRWRSGSSRCHRDHNREAGSPNRTAGEGCSDEVNAWPDPAAVRLQTCPANINAASRWIHFVKVNLLTWSHEVKSKLLV